MQTKTMIAAVVAAAFAIPLTATAGGTDKPAAAKSASTQTAPANGSNDGGAEGMFVTMDKNGDGFISKEEAMGTPHGADFASLDKNGDGKLSRDEHANAKEHVAARAKAAPTVSSATPATTTGTTAPASTTGDKKTY